nr:YqaJ viral recombinase family protein [uncultured Solibaculum sp.]
MGKITRISTNNMSHQDWLSERRKAIGGSDASTILGLNPYTSPYTLWADKTHRLPDQPDNEAMRQGRDLEPYVVRRFEEASAKRCRRVSAILRNSDYPWASANIDRAVIGESAGLECKTTSVLNLKKFRDGEFPDTYYCQCVHYLAVTRWHRWYLAVLVLNKALMIYQLTRVPDDIKPPWCESSVYVSDDEVQALMQAESDFWGLYVRTDVPPPMDGLEPTSRALSSIYPAAQDDDVLTLDCEDTLREYLALKRQINDLKTQQERCEQTIKEMLGQHRTGQCGNTTIKWDNAARRTFDHFRFGRENPDIDLSPYYNITQSRRFTVKEAK